MVPFPGFLYECSCFSISWLISLATGKRNIKHLLSSSYLPTDGNEICVCSFYILFHLFLWVPVSLLSLGIHKKVWGKNELGEKRGSTFLSYPTHRGQVVSLGLYFSPCSHIYLVNSGSAQMLSALWRSSQTGLTIAGPTSAPRVPPPQGSKHASLTPIVLFHHCPCTHSISLARLWTPW